MSKKIFVGSLPSDITDGGLRAEFSKYGMVEETFVKPGCEPGRQWAFVTFASPEQALHAKECCDRILIFPGSDRPCDVMPAKNQGMFGQGNDGMGGGYQAPVQQGPKKIFVGSLPDSINEEILRAEFSRYGQIFDVFLKQGCESGRQWAFVTYGTPAEAQSAKDATDRILVIPGADKACEVMLAKNQGKFGQDPVAHGGGGGGGGAIQPGGYGGGYGGAACGYGGCGGAIQQPCGYGGAADFAGGYAQQPQPPPLQMGASQWKTYRTAAGLPYYHNHATGQTQWEAPPELGGMPAPQMAPQMAGYAAYGGAGGAGYAVPGQARYSPY